MLDELGANHLGGGEFGFLLWAPYHEKAELKIVSPTAHKISMQRTEKGYFETVVPGIGAGCRYHYVLDGGLTRPDPASRFQPEGVHGPSQTVAHDAFGWTDLEWDNIPLCDYVFYELHVGTFTPEGTFDAVISRLPYLKELGITALELMPVCQFPGRRNWGYDGVYPYAVQDSYGGPEGLKSLVNECHAQGLAVVLDVVYNHLGPEGNYLRDFGPYFTDRYKTPWGEAVNFDGPGSDEVRRFFIDNAIYWADNFHIDALRIDAVHGIFDMSARHFLDELGEEVKKRSGRRVYLIPESDLNDVRLINPAQKGGYGLDAQWNDDFHHALHTLLTGEREGYYQDFGSLDDMAKALREGFVYTGQYSRFRDRRHGSSSAHIHPGRFVVFSQNHDQVGNRMLGDRLSASLSPEQLKLAAALVLLSPSLPLVFMGEEYGEPAPFRYFVSHSDPDLIEAVREGRKREFASFNWEVGVPDPQDETTFLRSKINLELRHEGKHGELYRFYRKLITLRKELVLLRAPEQREVLSHPEERVITVQLRRGRERLLCVASFNNAPAEVAVPEGKWSRILDSTAFEASGAAGGETTSGTVRIGPYGFLLYREVA